jgi:cell wall-associated NlpC family hydrolase
MSRIVEVARSYLGTPFAHQGRMPGVGLDCAGVVIAIARELGVVAPDFDITGYGRTPDGASLMGWCRQYMTEVPRSEMRPGDVLCVAWETIPHHLAVLGDYRHGGLSIIHSIDQRGKVRGSVVEHRLVLGDRMKFKAAFRMPEAA